MSDRRSKWKPVEQVGVVSRVQKSPQGHTSGSLQRTYALAALQSASGGSIPPVFTIHHLQLQGKGGRSMLLSAAYGESTGLAEILVGHYENKELKFDTAKWFQIPEELEAAEAFVEANSTEDVYFTPTLFSKRTRKAEFATVSNVVY